MKTKEIVCLAIVLSLILLGTVGCAKDTPTDVETTKTTDTADITDPTKVTDSTQAAEGDQTLPTDANSEPDISTNPQTPDDSAEVGVSVSGCYDNDALEISVAFLPEGTVYLMDSAGYWEGTYEFAEDTVTLIFAYKTEQGCFDEQGELWITGREGSFSPVEGSNGYGPKLETILSGEPAGAVPDFTGSWYNQTGESTIIFNSDGSVYQILSVAVMEGSFRKDGEVYLLSFTLGGKAFGPYEVRIDADGNLIWEGQEGTYIRQG